MDQNNFFYSLQPSNPSPQAALPVPQSTYHLHPQVYPGTSPTYGGYNPEWGPEQQHAFLRYVQQMTGGEPYTTGMAATTNDGTCQCRWLTGGIPCSQVFSEFQDLIVHLGSVHDVQGYAARKLVCQWLTDKGCCGKEYRRDGYKRHIGTHLGYSVPCTECGKQFSREDSMRAHRKKQHKK